MFPFQRILVPVDDSESCQAIVPYVKDMTRRFSAQLTLVHAYGGIGPVYGDLPFTYSDVEDSRGEEVEWLKAFADEMFPNQHVETLVKPGEAGDVIRAVARHQGTDLVMLPTHGRGAVRRFLLGSVAAKVLHDVDPPVWTGSRTVLGEHGSRIPYKSLLCAVDDTDEAQAVLKFASAFSGATGAALSLIHVVEMPPSSIDADLGPYLQDMTDAADCRLQELKTQLKIEAPHAILNGPTADAIAQEAVRRKADLIIAGRGRANTRVSRMWSHLYQIVRESPCPVLSL